jgi:hypothetical protein
MDSLYSKAHIRESLDPQPSTPDQDMQWLAGATAEIASKVRAALPSRRVPAAVLIPLVERDTGLTVLLTQRAETLKDHAGQISFPGGRIEPEDAGCLARGAARGHEEIGLRTEFVEFAGYLPDHHVITGFRVTPVVAFVNPSINCASPRPRFTMRSRCRWTSSWTPPITNPDSAPGGCHHRSARHTLRRAQYLGRDGRHADDPAAPAAGPRAPQ